MIDLFGNLFLGAWLAIGAGTYFWVLIYWLTDPEARRRYGPSTPVVATIVVLMWPVIFLLIWAGERTDYD